MNDSAVPVLSDDFDSFLSSLSTNPVSVYSSEVTQQGETSLGEPLGTCSRTNPNNDIQESQPPKVGPPENTDSSKFSMSSIFEELETVKADESVQASGCSKKPKTTRLKLQSQPSYHGNDEEQSSSNWFDRTKSVPVESEFLGLDQILDLFGSGEASRSNQNGFVTTPSRTSEVVRPSLEHKLSGASGPMTSSPVALSEDASPTTIKTGVTRRFGASARKSKLRPADISLESSSEVPPPTTSSSVSTTPDKPQKFVSPDFFKENKEPARRIRKPKQSPLPQKEEHVFEVSSPVFSPKPENSCEHANFIIKPLEIPLVKARRIKPAKQMTSPTDASDNASVSGSEGSVNNKGNCSSSRKCYSKEDMLLIAEKSRSYEVVPEFLYLTDDVKFKLEAGLKVLENYEPHVIVGREFAVVNFTKVYDPPNCLLRV